MSYIFNDPRSMTSQSYDSVASSSGSGYGLGGALDHLRSIRRDGYQVGEDAMEVLRQAKYQNLLTEDDYRNFDLYGRI